MRDNWLKLPISEIFQVSSGQGLTEEKMLPGSNPVYGGNGEIGFHNSFTNKIEELIIGRVGAHCGNVFITKPKSWITDNALVVRFQDKDEDLKFWLYKLNNLYLRGYAFQSAQPVITGGILKNIILNIPPLPHQRKIAQILSTCDAVIEKTEAAIAKYQAIKQGMMHDLFTRGILMEDITYTDKKGKVVELRRNQLRPKQEDAPELYKESELGWIPKEWEVMRLEEIAVISYGKDYKANPIGDNIPIYGTGGIMGWTSKILNNGPAVLTGRKGTINRPIYVEGGIWNVDTIFCINTYHDTNVKWFFFQMTSKDLTKLNEATGVPSVSSTALNKLKFSCPILSEQDEITNRINLIESKIKSEHSTLSKYRQIKAGLMQDLLSGKVEVKVDEEDTDNINN